MSAGPLEPPTWREAVGDRPRHVLLAALAAGLAGVPAILAIAVAPALRAPRLARPAVAAGAAVALLLGGALADARRGALERHTLPARAEIRGEATLLVAPRTGADGSVRALAVLRTTRGGRGRVLLRAQDAAALPARPGRIAAVSGRLRPPDRGAQAVHAHATLDVESARETGRRGGLQGALDGVRDRATTALATGLPAADGALLQGMVLGQDAALPEPLREDLQTAGLAHLVAASGQNVLLLATLALAAGALLGLPIRPRLVAVIGLVALYVPLAGAGPSIQRAGVMGAAGLAASLAGRPAARWYAVGLAAVVTLALDPRARDDPGWQMSFVAVGALALLAAPLTRWLRARGAPRGVAEALAVAIVATFATAPVAALHFGRASLLAVPANVVVAPAVAPVMWLGMLAAAAAQVAPGLAAPFVTAAAPLVAFVRDVGTVAAALPGADATVALWLVVATSAAVLAGVGLLALRQAAERREREGGRAARRVPLRVARAGAVLVTSALVTAWIGALAPRPAREPPAAGVLRLTFLDVGQGDATLLQAGEAAVLVDAGPAGTDLPRLLRRAGVRRLDALLISHDAADHHGGAAAVLRSIPTRLVVDGGLPARPQGVRRVTAVAGQVVRAGPLILRVLWPQAQAPVPGADPNDRAVVVEARAGGTRALLPADAESNVLGRLALGRAHVLKVSHHGSADAGLGDLLARVAPDIAVISAGRRNRYGHPAPETLRALTGVRRLLRTDRDGTVVVEGRGGRLAVGAGS